MRPTLHAASLRWPMVAGWSRSTQCNRRGRVERAGKPYCGQHDPEAVKARHEARRKGWEARERQDEAVQVEARRLARRLGIKGEAHFNALPRIGYYTRDLVISFKDAEKLIARIAAKA